MRKRSKTMKRLLGLLLSTTMVLGMVTTVSAAGNATITISEGSLENDWAGLTATAYKVFDDATHSGDTNKLYKVTTAFDNFFNIDAEPSNSSVEEAFDKGQDVYLTYDAANNKLEARTDASTISDKIKITLTGDDNKALDKTYGDADLVSRIGKSSENAKILYTWIEKYIEATSPQIAGESDKTTEANTSVTIDNLEDGYYALIFSGKTTNVNVTQGILVEASGSMTLKAEDIPFEKKVIDYTDDLTNPDLKWKDTESGMIGDIKGYYIDSTIPNLADNENLTQYKLTDTLSNQKITDGEGLYETGSVETGNYKLNAAPVLVINGTPAVFDSSTKTYKMDGNDIAKLTITPNGYNETNNNATFTIDFDLDDSDDAVDFNELLKYEGKKIKVYYYAQITGDAAQVNGNEATLDFTNNDIPTEDTDTTEVYTYGVKLRKKFSDGSTTSNYGAVTFQLFKGDNTDTDPLKLEKTEDGIYKVAQNQNANVAGNIVTNLKLNQSDGTLTITGLDDDAVVDYILKETETATGFNKVGNIEINLVAQTGENDAKLGSTTSIKIGGTAANVSFEDNEGTAIAKAVFDVYNQKGFSLPTTGGAGTWMLTIGGIAIIAVAGGLFIASRKKSFK